jgi:alpha-tubulin suppressor-like RCC1 family protein
MLVAGVMNSRSATIAEQGETRIDHPRATDAEKVSAGGNHTCAVISDGSLWCWGRNDKGQLGLGDTTDRSSPTRIGAATNWRSVSAGNNSTTCAVNTLNEVFCWGFNYSGQVGVDKATASVTSPTKVTALGTTVQSVSVGSVNSCVVTTASAVRCWGSSANGQLGSGVTAGSSTHTPTAINNLSGSFTVVAAGTDGICALRSDKVVLCWGSDLFGQRGDGSSQTADSAAPTQIDNTAAVAGLIAGSQSNCFVKEDNSAVYCWGQNSNNYLNSTSGNRTSPVLANVAPFSGNSARGFSVGSEYACMLRNSDGRILCGGLDTISVIGATGRVSKAPTSTGFLSMTTGWSHGCGVRSDRKLVCWGLNSYGQVGNGSTGTATDPTVVTFGANATQTLGADPVAPSAPGSVTVTGAYRSVDVAWTAPSSTGTAYVSDYEHRYSSNGGTSWSNWTSFGTTSTSGRISGLTPGTSYVVEVRAVTSDGTSASAASAGSAIPTSGCDPLKNCTLGAVGPNGGMIVSDAGPGNIYERFIEAAPSNWYNASGDPSTYWQEASSRAANWKSSWPTFSRLPTKDELISITNAYNANPQLLSGWGISYADSYWSSTDPYEDPIDDGFGGYTYPDDQAYAGSSLVSKSYYYQVRPVIALDGPSPLAAPTVTATAGELAISVSWTSPSVGSGGAITDFETRLSTNGGTSYGSWTSRGLVNSLELTGLTAGTSYRIEVRAINFAGNGAAGRSSVVTMTSSLSPSTQTVSGTVNTAITDSVAFATTNFNGAVTYSVTSGTLPAGLSLEANTGVVSGTPTAASTGTVTIRGAGATAGTASATITFAITTAPPGVVEGVWAIDGPDGVVLEWFSPTTGESATSYQYAVSTNGGQTFSAFAAVSAAFTTPVSASQQKLTAKITTGLTRGVETIFQMRALNGTTPGPVFPDPTASAMWTTWSPRATAKMSDPCDPMADCDLGDVGPAGGIIVYDHGSNASWGRYLESAPAFWNGTSGDPSALFGCAGTKITAAAGTPQQQIGAGVSNSAAVMTGCATAGIAVRLADAYSSTLGSSTFDDWHLPSSGDLVKIHYYRQYLGGWKNHSTSYDDKTYVSSTDFSIDYFYGVGGSKMKWFNGFVRPVRYVMGPAAPSAPGVVVAERDGRLDLVWDAPTNDGGNAVSDYEIRVSSDGGQTWATWTSLGLVTSHSLTSLTNGSNYAVEVRAVNRGGSGASSSSGTVSPGAHQVNGVEGTALSSVTLFAQANLASGVSYAVTSGTLPAGLSLNSTSGAVSGTPTAPGTSTVTVTATIGSSTASVDATFTIAPAPPPSTVAPTTTIASSSPSTSSPGQSSSNQGTGSSNTNDEASSSTTTTIPAALAPLFSPDTPSSNDGSATSQSSAQTPTLITPERKEQLTAPAGGATMLVDGVLVEVTLVKASEELRNVPPQERSAEQIEELRDLADAMIAQIQASLGANELVPISVVKTPTGAVIVGLVTDPRTGKSIKVPVEHVVLIQGGGLLLMVAGSNGTEPARVGTDGVLEISKGGVVSVLAYGLTPGVAGEVVVMSKPRLISKFEVARDGGASAHAKLPTDLKVGSHTVVVTVGAEAASLGFRITGAALRSSIPVTGRDPAVLLNIALATLMASAMLLIIRRRGCRLR